MSQSPFDNSIARSEAEMVLDQMTKQQLRDSGRNTGCNSPNSGKQVNISSMSDMVPEMDTIVKAVAEVSEDRECSPMKGSDSLTDINLLDKEIVDPELRSPESSRPGHKPKQSSAELLASMTKSEKGISPEGKTEEAQGVDALKPSALLFANDQK